MKKQFLSIIIVVLVIISMIACVGCEPKPVDPPQSGDRLPEITNLEMEKTIRAMARKIRATGKTIRERKIPATEIPTKISGTIA